MIFVGVAMTDAKRVELIGSPDIERVDSVRVLEIAFENLNRVFGFAIKIHPCSRLAKPIKKAIRKIVLEQGN